VGGQLVNSGTYAGGSTQEQAKGQIDVSGRMGANLHLSNVCGNCRSRHDVPNRERVYETQVKGSTGQVPSFSMNLKRD
jgi:hypothetical protein